MKTLAPLTPLPADRPKKAILIWLISIATLITIMVSIGGVTRLTGSGLSITDWKPIMGAIPPLSDTDWTETFEKYRATPQGQTVNSGMTIDAFKQIYFWEYFHRLVGRLIGIVAFLPLVYFWIRKRIEKKLARKVLIGTALGGLQGVLGWFMVMSGLVNVPSVSHFRLAAHLSLALFILAYFVWIIREEWVGSAPLSQLERENGNSYRNEFLVLRALLCLQIIYGAFVAGLKAGFGFNTFPKMAGEWIPGNFWAQTPHWVNLFENPASVQWIHRALGTLVILGAISFYARLRARRITGELKFWGTALSHMILVQFALGVATLVFVVPIPLAVAHQFGAAIIVILLTCVTHVFKRI